MRFQAMKRVQNATSGEEIENLCPKQVLGLLNQKAADGVIYGYM